MLKCTICRRSEQQKGHKEQERRVRAANYLVFFSRLMVRMINEWHWVHRGFALAERGIILAFGKRKRSRKLDGWKKREKANDVCVSAANHRDGHVLNVSEAGRNSKKSVTAKKLIDARLSIFSSLHRRDVTSARDMRTG